MTCSHYEHGIIYGIVIDKDTLVKYLKIDAADDWCVCFPTLHINDEEYCLTDTEYFSSNDINRLPGCEIIETDNHESYVFGIPFGNPDGTITSVNLSEIKDFDSKVCDEFFSLNFKDCNPTLLSFLGGCGCCS